MTLARKTLLLASLLALVACGSDDPGGSPDAGNDVAADGAILPDGTVSKCSEDKDCTVSSVCRKAACVGGYCLEEVLDDGSACDDGDPCTSPDVCTSGQCGGALICECKTTADCKAKDDDDLCNGSFICDTTGAAPKCVINPASVVTCAPGDDPCMPATCDPKDAKCKPTPAADGTACDDGLPCSTSDACAGGTCKGDEKGCACQADADCKDDDDKCNGAPYCDKSGATWTCKTNPATVVVCAKGDAAGCSAPKCVPKTGDCVVQPKDDGAGCDVDGSPCSLDKCAGGDCKPGVLDPNCSCKSDADCAAFEDATVCNGTLYCNLALGTCDLNPATVITCPTGSDSACEKNTCDDKTGKCALKKLVDGFPCDDGFDCTKGESCKAGTCTPTQEGCQCTSSGDCDKYAAANACVGKMYCNKPEGQCRPNPATVVTCPVTGDSTCLKNQCDPKDGACKMTAVNEGKACEADNNWCTSVDICKEGKCLPADNKCPCKSDADCQGKQDANPCNGTLYCDLKQGACVVAPNTAPKCSGGTACKPVLCDPADGKCKATPLADDTPCNDDGFVCSKDVCKAGECKQQSNSCLCWEDSDCAGFEDGDACNGTLYCDKTAGPPSCKVNPGTVVTCAAPLPGACTVATCDPKDGQCKPKPGNEGKACDDADPCTTKDACAGGSCAGLPVAATLCDDANVCTLDTCTKGKGCTHAPAAGACDDGDACTDKDSCKAGKCAPGSALACDDGNACTKDSCNPKSGCVASPTPGLVCDDDNPCTTGDVCQAGGTCKGPGTKDCDDDKPCTADSCDKGSGCVNAAATGPKCDDDDACTTVDTCDKGVCKGSTPPKCTSSNPCKVALCDTKVGCTTKDAAEGKACSDGDACTVGDSCSQGICSPGKAANCDDKEVCTKDSCDKVKGCVNAPVAKGTACSDANLCGGVSLCDQGKCVVPADDKLAPIHQWNKAGAIVSDIEQLGLGEVAAVYQSPGAKQGRVVRRDAAGKLWAAKLVAPQGAAWLLPGHIIARPANSKELLLCGAAGTGAAVGTPYIQRLDRATGASLGVASLGQLPVGHCAGLINGVEDDFAYAVTLSGAWFCTAKIGTPSSCADLTKGSAGQISGLERGPGGAAYAAGVTVKAGGLKEPWFAKVGIADRKIQKFHSFAVSGNEAVAGVLDLGNDDALVYGHAKVGGKLQAWMRRIPAQGGPVALNVKGGPDAIYGAELHHNGGVAILGAKTVASGASHAWYGLVHDTTGYLVERPLIIGTASAAQGAQMIPGGGVLVAGWMERKGVRGTWLAQLDKLTTPTCLVAGTCKGKKPADCDDGKACTLDVCDPAKGCVSTPLFAGASCEDGNPCTVFEMCDAKGVCGNGDGKNCNDGNPCTKDACDPKSGCTHGPLSSGSCNDGDPCTVSDTCSGGKCGGQPNLCDDGKPCTNDSCSSPKGCVHVQRKEGELCVGGRCTDPDKLGTVDCEAWAFGAYNHLHMTSSGGVYRGPKGGVWGWGYPAGAAIHSKKKGTTRPYAPYPIDELPKSNFITGGHHSACALTSQGIAWCSGFYDGGWKIAPLVDAKGKAVQLSWLAGTRMATGDFQGQLWGVGLDGSLWSWPKLKTQGTQLQPAGNRMVDAGYQHACAVKSDGKVACWGKDTYGALGNGSATGTVTLAKATAVAGVSGAKHLCAGRYHTCASSGTQLWCWGRGLEGQLGNGSTGTKTSPALVTKPSGFVYALTCSEYGACAMVNGKVHCWGANEKGQVGLGHTQVVNKLGAAVSMGHADAMDAIGETVCARTSTGVVNCWGENRNGLMRLYTNGSDGDPTTPSVPKVLAGEEIHDVFGDERTTLFSLGKAKKLFCLGDNSEGQCGQGNNTERVYTTPVEIKFQQGAPFSVGYHGGVALSDGPVTWGYNQYGQVTPSGKAKIYGVTFHQGIGAQQQSFAVQACVGTSYTCARLHNGKVVCWGRNDNFQVGSATKGDKVGFTEVPGASLTTISCGGSWVCGLDANNQAWCWGRNFDGQLGDGTKTSRHTAKKVSGNKQFTSIGTGLWHTCALEKGSGAVWCWGGRTGFVRYLGHANAHSAVPQKVGLPKAAKALKVGEYVACAQLSDDTLRCWGSNSSGALATGNTTTPGNGAAVEPKGLGAVSKFWVAGKSACAVQTSSGKTLCWGGEGSPVSGVGTWGSKTPVKVAP